MFTLQALKERYEGTNMGEVFTVDEFCELVEEGCINQYDGRGYLHDGYIKYAADLFNLTKEDFKRAKYVIWFNK